MQLWSGLMVKQPGATCPTKKSLLTTHIASPRHQTRLAVARKRDGTIWVLSEQAHDGHLRDGPNTCSRTFRFISRRLLGRPPCSPSSPPTKTPFSLTLYSTTLPLTILTLTVRYHPLLQLDQRCLECIAPRAHPGCCCPGRRGRCCCSKVLRTISQTLAGCPPSWDEQPPGSQRVSPESRPEL